MTNLNSETIESRLQQRLAERMEAVRGLIAARAELDATRAAVSAAEQVDAAAWQTALDAGWTVNELKQSGLSEPTVKRTRKARPKPRGLAVDESTTPTNFGGTNGPPQNSGS
ncbi:hypothetical protein ACT3TS_17495 [Specibacter sp. AOP5-B1-6]|uniref:hypothetical protein n=1 Tax=Specibacter sp. AOP5-B1-6 TaxID=3457653 RepID=UPI00402BD946